MLDPRGSQQIGKSHPGRPNLTGMKHGACMGLITMIVPSRKAHEIQSLGHAPTSDEVDGNEAGPPSSKSDGTSTLARGMNSARLV